MNLVSLPEDTYFEILERLIVDEILQLRLTCKMFYEFTSRRVVWHSINKRLLAARPSPRIESLLPSMTASELMQNALRIVALYRRWREPIIRPRRKRLIALKRRTYPARAMCVPGTDFILEVHQTGCIYLGTYQDNSPSFTLTQPFLRRGQPGHSMLCERLGIDEPFTFSVALNEDCRLRWSPTGWVFVVPSIAMPDRTAYWFNVYDVQISPPSIVLRLTIFVDQPVQSYDIEDDVLVCYSGPIEQLEGVCHRLFIKHDPFNPKNTLGECSVMRPISGDPHTRVAVLSSCHVLLVSGSIRDIYQLVNQGTSDPLPSVCDLPLSVPVWTMSDALETINNESAPPITSVSRDLGRCAIFFGHRVDILEGSLSHPTFIFNTITHLIRDSGYATYTLNALGHWRAFQGSRTAISVFDGGLEVCTFSLADQDDIIYREDGIGRVAVSRIPKLEIPGFDKAYMVADEEGARLCITMKEKLSSRTFLVIVDI